MRGGGRNREFTVLNFFINTFSCTTHNYGTSIWNTWRNVRPERWVPYLLRIVEGLYSYLRQQIRFPLWELFFPHLLLWIYGRYFNVHHAVKVLCYKSESRCFDPSWCQWVFIDIKSFRSHYGPGVDRTSNRNGHQEYFLGVKAAGA